MTIKNSNTIQILRGLAIIAVVFIHNTPIGLPQVFVRPFLNFSVGLFLFMSGILSNAEKYNPKKRIKKVIIPYIIWTAVYVILGNFKTPADIPLQFVKGILTANSAPVMYYIFVYCELTLLIPFIDKLARSKYKFLGFIITPAEIICVRLIPIILNINIPYISILSSISCLGWFTYFYLGYLMGNDMIKIDIFSKKLSVFLIFSLIMQMGEGYFYYSLNVENCGTQLKLSSILSGTIFCLICSKFIASPKDYSFKILTKLGNVSFGIYFAHMAVMKFLNFIPYYSTYAIYPLNALSALLFTYLFVIIGKKILGKNSKYFAL